MDNDTNDNPLAPDQNLTLKGKGIWVNPVAKRLALGWARDLSNELAWEIENIKENERIRLTGDSDKA